MNETLAWLFALLALYWIYCVLWAVRGARGATTASEYFIAGRDVGIGTFVLTLTTACFSGWVFLEQAGFAIGDGFEFSSSALFAICIPVTAALFFKRQWMLSKRFGYITPGEMFEDYFQSNLVRWLVVFIAVIFGIPFVGLLLRTCGTLVEWLSADAIDAVTAMWLLSIGMIVYIVAGGLRALVNVGAVQCVLFVVAAIVIGGALMFANGGAATFEASVEALHAEAVTHNARDLFQLTIAFAFMGILASPAFSMLAFASHSPRPFARQQLWASAFCVGLLLALLAVFQSAGGDGVADADYGDERTMSTLLHQIPIALRALLAIGVLAALQCAIAAYLSCSGAIVTRDVIRPFVMPNVDHAQQKTFARLTTLAIAFAALIIATVAGSTLASVASLAMAYAFQLWPALLAVCWFPWFTRAGVNAGLVTGLIVVTLTEASGAYFAVPWERWPLDIHSAGWGIMFNLAACLIISSMTQSDVDTTRRMTFHNFLREHDALDAAKRSIVPAAWCVCLGWFFFALGPGAVLGNTLFGLPGDASTWDFGIPSVWVWRIMFWALGLFMLWLLAYQMELSTQPTRAVKPLVDDIGDRDVKRS